MRTPYKQLEKREAKGKGEKETYTHLNAEFQRIARSNKKAFFTEQYKEIAKNNRMGKTIEISSRKLEIPRNISYKDGHNKDRNGMDLTKVEDIKKR